MKIAFVTHNGFAALNGGLGRHIGGVERQTSLLAKWLAARGHEVTVLTWDEGQGREIEIDGVRNVSMCRSDAGLPIIRFAYPKWWSLNRALAAADADLYFHNGAEVVTGQVALWCRRRNRRFVFSVASDLDCTGGLGGLPRMRERVLYRHGLRHADAVITQTSDQADAMLRNFGRKSTVLRMGAVDPVADGRFELRCERWHARRVCWVGRLSPEKRIERLLEAATRLPEIHFDLAGGPSEKTLGYGRDLMAEAAKLSNVTMHGRLGSEDLARLYEQSSLLCCTSAYEGYPNVFIEAWAHGIPVVSTVDPGGVIARHELGAHAESTEGICEGIVALLRDEQRWGRIAINCRRFFEQEHALDSAFGKFEALFASLLECPRRYR